MKTPGEAQGEGVSGTETSGPNSKQTAAKRTKGSAPDAKKIAAT